MKANPHPVDDDCVPVLVHKSRLDVQVAHFFASDCTVQLLRMDMIKRLFRLQTDEAAFAEQVAYTRLGIMGLLSDTQSTTAAVAAALSEDARASGQRSGRVSLTSKCRVSDCLQG